MQLLRSSVSLTLLQCGSSIRADDFSHVFSLAILQTPIDALVIRSFQRLLAKRKQIHQWSFAIFTPVPKFLTTSGTGAYDHPSRGHIFQRLRRIDELRRFIQCERPSGKDQSLCNTPVTRSTCAGPTNADFAVLAASRQATFITARS